MKKFLFVMMLMLFTFSQAYAQGRIADGTYVLDDGNMVVTINIKSLPDGNYQVDGSGESKQGSKCRIVDMVVVEGNYFMLETCTMMINISDDRFQLNDIEKCAECEQGAYVSGTFVKK